MKMSREQSQDSLRKAFNYKEPSNEPGYIDQISSWLKSLAPQPDPNAPIPVQQPVPQKLQLNQELLNNVQSSFTGQPLTSEQQRRKEALEMLQQRRVSIE